MILQKRSRVDSATPVSLPATLPPLTPCRFRESTPLQNLMPSGPVGEDQAPADETSSSPADREWTGFKGIENILSGSFRHTVMRNASRFLLQAERSPTDLNRPLRRRISRSSGGEGEPAGCTGRRPLFRSIPRFLSFSSAVERKQLGYFSAETFGRFSY